MLGVVKIDPASSSCVGITAQDVAGVGAGLLPLSNHCKLIVTAVSHPKGVPYSVEILFIVSKPITENTNCIDLPILKTLSLKNGRSYRFVKNPTDGTSKSCPINKYRSPVLLVKIPKRNTKPVIIRGSVRKASPINARTSSMRPI